MPRAAAEAGRWGGEEERFLTLAEYDDRRVPFEDGEDLLASEVLVLVMASRSLSQRAELIEEGWARSSVKRLYLVDEWLEGVPREKQWRSGGGAREGASVPSGGQAAGATQEDSSYWDAQSRQLEFMRTHPSVEAASEGAKWVMLADDDTWVYIEALLAFTAKHDPSVPVLFSYILSDAHVLGYDYPCGGAGMLLSAAAYNLVAPHLLTPTCPLLSYNDLTLGYCVHAHGIPLVHHPGMHCAPDVNRAMRSGENLLDLQRGLSVHRLPAFRSFADLVAAIGAMEGQLGALVEHRCGLIARSGQTALDSRMFFWTLDAFEDAVATCRAHAPWTPTGGPLHLGFLMYGRGHPVHRYHRDAGSPLAAAPQERKARWPDWLEQLRHLGCAGSGVTWRTHWLDTVPRISKRQVEASDLEQLARDADLTAASLQESFAALEAQSPRGSWLDELTRVVRQGDFGRELRTSRGGRNWLFLDLQPATTFVNVFESARQLRALSDLFRSGQGEAGNPYADDQKAAVDLGTGLAPPLALAYEYSSLDVEPDSGVWLNGVAIERLLKCPTLRHPIVLDSQAHANDWETESERTALLWHNALAVDIFRTIRFCGVILLHAPRMVPHGLSYLPYSTFRRVHAPSVASAMTIGNIASRQQVYAMAQLSRLRACRARRRRPRAGGSRGKCPAPWRTPFRMRVLGGTSELGLTREQWSLPGARFLGMGLVAFRSEHFLPDAQAVRSGPR